MDFDRAADRGVVEVDAATACALGDVDAAGRAGQGDGARGIDNGNAARLIGTGACDIGIDRAVKHGDDRCAAGVVHRLEGAAVVADRDAAQGQLVNVALGPRLDIAGGRCGASGHRCAQVKRFVEDDCDFRAGDIVVGAHTAVVVAGHDTGCGALEHCVAVPASVEVGVNVGGHLFKAEHFSDDGCHFAAGNSAVRVNPPVGANNDAGAAPAVNGGFPPMSAHVREACSPRPRHC